MSVPRPRAGSPQDPRDEGQQDPGPIISPPAIPGVGYIDKRKFAFGKFAGKMMRAGKK